MSSFADQIKEAKVAHLAASSLEAVVRQQIVSSFDAWGAGDLDAQTIRHRLEAIVRSSYRASVAVATEHAVQQSEIPGWRPKTSVFNTKYLKEMLKDVRRNLRDYKAGPKQEADRRRAILNIQHSAGVAAQRGYTDAIISSYAELETFGHKLRKFWLANFKNNDPCSYCRDLHGKEVGLHDEFHYNKHVKAKVYLDLQGPPRHPRCQCILVILIVTLENSFDPLDIDAPTPPPPSATTEDIKNLPLSVFWAIITALKKVVEFVKNVIT